jgi:class 3 adenylate cyclase
MEFLGNNLGIALNITVLYFSLKEEVSMAVKDWTRKNAILMIYDIVGFTTYCDYHETRGNDKRVYEIIHKVIDGSNDIIRDFGGDPRTFSGDGYFSSFNGDAFENAIDAALYIQDLAREVRKDFDGGRNPRLKAALYRGSTLFGYVDLTERPLGRAPCKLSGIEGLAKPGDTLASGSVIEPVIDLYEAEKLPKTPLKGISEIKEVYSVKKKIG